MNSPVYVKSIAASGPCLVEMPPSPCSGSHSPCWLPRLMEALLTPAVLISPASWPSCGWGWAPHHRTLMPLGCPLCGHSCALPHLVAVGPDSSGRGEGFSGILGFTLRFLAVELSFFFFFWMYVLWVLLVWGLVFSLILGSLQKFMSGSIHQLQVFFPSFYKYTIMWVWISFISLFLMSWFFCYVFYFFLMSFGRVP